MAEATRVGRAARPDKAVREHRKDVEGLRAVSILTVMAWHAGLTQVPGGFVGLDVFFVISGYLITHLLVTELRRTRRLRLRRFYARRAKRLLPALTVVLLVVAVLAWLLLPRTRWITTAYDIMVSAVYGMNWRLAAQSVDYFQENAEPSLLQHVWSLAVEEQFYIVWPILLVIAARLVRRRRQLLNPALLVAFTVIGVPSFAWSVYYTELSPGPAYFVTTTRLWELALGSGLAILAVHHQRIPRAVAIALGWSGMAAIVAAALLFTVQTPFPSYWALIPVLGAGAIIVAGRSAGSRGPVALLGTPPMQVIGRLSYSLYLVHWPALVLAAAVLGALTPVQGVAVTVAAAVPAYLLHRYVENPIRFSTGLARDSAHTLRVAGVATVVSLTAGAALQLADWPPASPFVQTEITQLSPRAAAQGTAGVPLVVDGVVGAGVLGADPRDDVNGTPADTVPSITPDPQVATEDELGCGQSIEDSAVESCTFGDPGSPTVVALVGDSLAAQWIAGLDEVAKQRGWKLVAYTKGACPFADVTIVRNGRPYASCRDWNTALRDQLLGTARPSLVIASNGEYAAGRPAGGAVNGTVTAGAFGVSRDGGVLTGPDAVATMSEGLRRHYEALTGAGIPVVVLRNTPAPGADVPSCVIGNPNTLARCAGSRFQMTAGAGSGIGAEQVQAVNGLDKATLIDLNDAICPTDRCSAVIGNVLVYRDGVHMTGTYVRTLVPRLAAALAELLT